MLWDTAMLKQLEVRPTEHANVTLCYSHVRSKLQFAVKDFVEKRITFAHEDAVYSFFSASANSEEEFAPVEGVERGETHYGVMRVSRDPMRGVVVEAAMKCDGKLPVSNAVLKTLVPSAVKDWTSKLQTYLLTHR